MLNSEDSLCLFMLIVSWALVHHRYATKHSTEKREEKDDGGEERMEAMVRLRDCSGELGEAPRAPERRTAIATTWERWG